VITWSFAFKIPVTGPVHSANHASQTDSALQTTSTVPLTDAAVNPDTKESGQHLDARKGTGVLIRLTVKIRTVIAM